MLANHLLMSRRLCTLWLKEIKMLLQQIQDRILTLFIIFFHPTGENNLFPQCIISWWFVGYVKSLLLMNGNYASKLSGTKQHAVLRLETILLVQQIQFFHVTCNIFTSYDLYIYSLGGLRKRNCNSALSSVLEIQ